MLLGSTGDQFQRNAEGSQIWSIFKPAIQSYLYERQQKKFNLAKVKSLVCSPATTIQQMILFPDKTFNRHQQICFFFQTTQKQYWTCKIYKSMQKRWPKIKNIYQKTLQLLKGGMTALEKSYASSAGMLATHFRCDKNTIRYGGSTALQTVFTAYTAYSAYTKAPTVRMMSKEHFLLMSVLDFVLTFLAP